MTHKGEREGERERERGREREENAITGNLCIGAGAFEENFKDGLMIE